MSLYSEYFFFDTIRKYTYAFGSLFDNIQIVRENSNGTESSRERVPIQYASKMKWALKTNEDPDLNRKIAEKLPRMSYEFLGFSKDVNRQLSPINSLSHQGSDNGSRVKQFTPVPYKFDFDLYIQTKNQIEGNMIVEQILPFFSPYYPLTIQLVNETCLQVDTPVTLNNITFDDQNHLGDMNERRIIIWTLNFTLSGYIFSPTTQSKVIKTSIVDVSSIDLNKYFNITEFPKFPGKTLQQIVKEDNYTVNTTITES